MAYQPDRYPLLMEIHNSINMLGVKRYVTKVKQSAPLSSSSNDFTAGFTSLSLTLPSTVRNLCCKLFAASAYKYFKLYKISTSGT